VQSQFVTDPAGAVVAGDELVTRLVRERGYPTENFDDELAYLSVEHARVLGHYRDAHEIYLRAQRDEANTEDLRQALVHYRELFADLLGSEPVPAEPTSSQPVPAEPTSSQPVPAEPTSSQPVPAEPTSSQTSGREYRSRNSGPSWTTTDQEVQDDARSR
jgi:hypothetical protein